MKARFLRFNLHSGEILRSRLLERLLARADETVASLDWRADAFSVLVPGAQMPPLAALALRAAPAPAAVGEHLVGSDSAEQWVCAATPVHYHAEMSNVRFAGEGILSLEAAEAADLAQSFNATWQGTGVQLRSVGAHLFCLFDVLLEVTTHSPERARGHHLEGYLPAGRDGRRLRGLMSEMEMWLFGHPLNERRTRDSQLTLSSLWLWGGGPPIAELPVLQGTVAGCDFFFDAFAAHIDGAADVMITEAAPGTPAWHDVESTWLEPTLRDLRRGRLSRLELSAAERLFVLGARSLRRFWRRSRPWWEFFAE